MVLILSFLFYKKEPLRPLIFYILNAEKVDVFTYESNLPHSEEVNKAAILASPHVAKPRVIIVKNQRGQDEYLYGGSVGAKYSTYLCISYYSGIVVYRESDGDITITTLKGI